MTLLTPCFCVPFGATLMDIKLGISLGQLERSSCEEDWPRLHRLLARFLRSCKIVEKSIRSSTAGWPHLGLGEIRRRTTEHVWDRLSRVHVGFEGWNHAAAR